MTSFWFPSQRRQRLLLQQRGLPGREAVVASTMLRWLLLMSRCWRPAERDNEKDGNDDDDDDEDDEGRRREDDAKERDDERM